MARNDNGHADLNDIYDRLGQSNNQDLLREVRLTNLLLATLLRAHGAQVPIAKYMAVCNKCAHQYTFVQHEGQSQRQPLCAKCGVVDEIKLYEL